METSTENLYKNLRGQLKAFINSKVRNEALAEDILHDTFLKVHEKLHTLRENEKIVSWIYQIARNAVTDYFREKKHEPLTEEIAESTSNEIAQRLESSIRNMIGCLPKDSRDVLLLTEYQGMKQKDLAEKLGISLPAVKSRVLRARKKLKEILFECCHFEFDRFGTVLDYYRKSNSCTCCSS